MTYETIIGLEIHVQLKTKTKMFCSCENNTDEKKPNTHVCEICLGHPGVLPVPNKQAIEFGIKAACALNCEIAQHTKFDRKNYFYPDLPKGYQISQFDEPLAKNGFIEIFLDEKTTKKFKITRLHLEEDAAKNIHLSNKTAIDFNRSGVPLAEIVTEPDFRTPQEAKLFLQELRGILRYIGVSDADMEKGQLRCDANISLRKKGDEKLYPKTEIKNLNSFRAVERALMHEEQRQKELWEENTPPTKQSTRGWNEDTETTVLQRTKEESHDYRYFPEPDIPPLHIEPSLVESIRATLPELPFKKRMRLHLEYGLNLETLNQFVLDKKRATYFEQLISELHDWILSLDQDKENKEQKWEQDQEKIIKLISGWFLSKLPNLLEKSNQTFDDLRIKPENFAEFLSLLYKDAINTQTGLIILEKMISPKTQDTDPSHIMESLGLSQIDNQAEIELIAKEVLQNNPKQVEQYKNGKTEIINFLLGKVMKESKGKANPKIGMEILKKLLGE